MNTICYGHLKRAMLTFLDKLAVKPSDSTPMYVFKEVDLPQIAFNSRRADVIIYVPGTVVFLIEYKTIESKRSQQQMVMPHLEQLHDTYRNLINCVSLKQTLLPSTVEFREEPMPVVSLLYTRHFAGAHRIIDAKVHYYSPDERNTLMLRDTVNQQTMIDIFLEMGSRA